MTGILPPGKFPLEGSTPVVSPPEYSPHEKYAWKQRCLALREICRRRKPVPTRVLNPNASEASYKPEQRRGGTFLGGIYRGRTELGGIVRVGVYLEPIYIYIYQTFKELHMELATWQGNLNILLSRL